MPAIREVVNAFYAEKIRGVLQKMQEVLSKIETDLTPALAFGPDQYWIG